MYPTKRRESVVLEGLTFTRQQIETSYATISKAMQELNTPEVVEPTHLMRVRRRLYGVHHEGVVLVGDLQRDYVRGFNERNGHASPSWRLSGSFTVAASDGTGFTHDTAASLWQSWEPVTETEPAEPAMAGQCSVAGGPNIGTATGRY